MQVNDCGNQLGLLSVKQPGMLFIIFFITNNGQQSWSGKDFKAKVGAEGFFLIFLSLLIFKGGVRGAAEETSCGNTRDCQ